MSAYSFLTFMIFAFKGIDKIKLYGRYLNHRSNPHVKGLCFLKIHLFLLTILHGKEEMGSYSDHWRNPHVGSFGDHGEIFISPSDYPFQQFKFGDLRIIFKSG